jgi:O-antigen ligase
VEITPIGRILLPLGAGFYLLAPQFLYPVMVFFLPFSATAVVNVGSADSASGVQASMFFGALWMLRELPSLGQYLRLQHIAPLRAPVRRLGLFVLVVCLSLIMPLWINGHLVIESSELGDSGSAPLQFSVRHITQTLYLVYGILLAILVAIRNSDSQELARSTKIFLISAVFVSLWAFLQFFCWTLNREYPAYIFNTSATESALGYTQELQDMGLKRISSVTTEPSMFAQCMLVAAMLALFTVVRARPLISRTWDRLAVGTIIGGLLISTSTTAYVGLALTLFLYLLALKYLGVLRRRYVIALFLLAGMLLYALAVYSPARDMFESLVLNKGDTYSALARLNSVWLAWDYFLQYPLLGVGWGSVTSHDLIFKLLSNTGVVGLFVFLLFLWTALSRLYRAARNGRGDHSKSRLWPVCLLATSIVLIFTNIVGGFAFSYGDVWFVFGLAISVPALTSGTASTKPGNFYPDAGALR